MEEEDIITVKDLHNHKQKVGQSLQIICNELMRRAIVHDASKFFDDELKGNLKAQPEKRALQATGHIYGSIEDNKHREEYKWLSDKHYSRNRHHPEYHHNGINDMSLIDLVEMLCDWWISGDNIDHSIRENIKKFNIDAQLARSLKNTIRDMKDLS